MAEATIGIIGGSGLYKMVGLEDVKEVAINTPFGKPSDSFVIGHLEGQRVAFLPRHGRGHRIMPGEIPFRANIRMPRLNRSIASSQPRSHLSPKSWSITRSGWRKRSVAGSLPHAMAQANTVT